MKEQKLFFGTTFVIWRCSVCTVTNKCSLIDSRIINFYKELQEYDVVLGDLNLLGWVILKYDSKFNKILNEPLAKNCAVDENCY